MYGSPVLTSVYSWSTKDLTWRRIPLGEAPQFVVSEGDETILARTTGDKTEFHFERSGQTLTVGVPVPTLLGKPAWDEHHIWAPTASGLYEINRATGRMTWLAYEDGNFFRSVLRAAGRLYISTNRGVYYRDLSPTPTLTVAPAAKPATSMPTVEHAAPKVAAISLPVEVSLEGDAKAEVTLQMDHRQTLLKMLPGDARISLPAGTSGEHHIFFHCPGYASQWVYLKIADGKMTPDRAKIKLFRKRYVVLRCSFNTSGQRNLEGDDVEEQHLALSHWTGPKYFNQDWQVWQKSNGAAMFGDVPYLEFHRYCTDFGFKKPPAGTSYDEMNGAPASGYHCENIKAEKGLVLYCRVNGNAKEGIGYGKLVVEAVTDKPPEDVQVVEPSVAKE